MQGESVEVLAAIVAGLLALIGGYFGARASRRTEYEKWLRQEQSTAFAFFIKELHKTWLEMPPEILRNPLVSPDADRYITQAFVRLEPSKNIVRLYLKDNDREPFSKLVQDIWAAQTSSALTDATRSQKTQEAMLSIQHIFERQLHG
jgi:hypothetical protein